MKKILVLTFSILVMISCDKKQEAKQAVVPEKITEVDSTLIRQQQQMAQAKKQVDSLVQKKDSLLQVVTGTQQTLARLNDSKNEQGIASETLKLNQLSGQKSNYEEEINFRKKEIELTDKKLELYNQEKAMYQDHKKAMYAKGAKPQALAKIDTLLTSVNTKISRLNTVSEEANKALAQAKDDATTIDDQQDAMSKKISTAYLSKVVFEDFAKQEKIAVDAQIQELDSIIDIRKIAISTMAAPSPIEKDSLTMGLLAPEKSKNTIATQKETKNRLYYAFGAVGIVIVVFGLFNFIGKKKKTSGTDYFN
ncbi:hypothetical protein FFWV33_00915 [Flavobacterium faecale]|uniref:Uncharacterized protein n=1 Tax=Flavobacterium faecale TaxID=1355330 RepID=A0A2S1L8Z9_9FLAO|nr:hypothetical protein [Flavobacterium faecale]AWG20184.1 hypothetical protein FFWV33_00915 [Flavobacterium faecale]